MVFNREDALSERLLNYHIRVGNSTNALTNPTCTTNSLSGGGIFSCNLWGRYLSITLHTYNQLTLCEVKAFETPNILRLGLIAV